MRVPRYRKHQSGQAVVTLNGKDHYLGLYDSPESREKYRRLTSAYVAEKGRAAEPGKHSLFLSHAIDYFTQRQLPRIARKEAYHYSNALDHVGELFGRTLLSEFGPVRYKKLQERFIDTGWVRRHINYQGDRVRRFLAWCVSEELYPESQLRSIERVRNVQKGDAPESKKVVPPRMEDVEATLPHLSIHQRGMVEFMRLTGARPCESSILCPRDLNRDGVAELPGGRTVKLAGTWIYVPTEHKTEWAEKFRFVVIGPRAQAVLAPLLEHVPDDHYVFTPSKGVASPVPSHRYRGLSKAMKKAFADHSIRPWFPYQLRHHVGTYVKQECGEEAAKDVLGHSSLDTTSIYAERSLTRAAEAMRRLG
jgi:integrase